MRKDVFKVGLFLCLIVFAVMFGMELSDSGIKSVYGTLDNSTGRKTITQAPAQQTGTGRGTGSSASSKRYADEPPGLAYDGQESADESGTQDPSDVYSIPRNDHQPVVDRIAGKTAETLQGISRGGIHFIVSLFDKVAGDKKGE